MLGLIYSSEAVYIKYPYASGLNDKPAPVYNYGIYNKAAPLYEVPVYQQNIGYPKFIEQGYPKYNYGGQDYYVSA